MRKQFFILVLAVLTSLIVMAGPVAGKQFDVGGNALNLFGYISQTAQFGAAGDHHDTQEGLQQAITNLFVEANYEPSYDLTLYGAAMFTADVAYQINDDDSDWKTKGFDKARDAMNVDDEYWQMLKEVHATWTPGDFFFRVGKQIVSWGEMDFNRVIEQINPADGRRGFGDVEFESTIIPIWLVRAEYWAQPDSNWLTDLGFQFIFNPNADFIPDQGMNTGNDVAGIWAVNVVVDDGFGGLMRIGSPIETINEPDEWDPDEFEFGFRVSATIMDTLLNLHGFYGWANSPTLINTGYVLDPTFPPDWGVPLTSPDTDGIDTWHFTYDGYYARQKFLGATWTADLDKLQFPITGGVSPVVRVEAMYELDRTFRDTWESMAYESDFLSFGVGIDWKLKIPFLNSRSNIAISPQYFYYRVMDYPDNFKLIYSPYDEVHQASLILYTGYFSQKLVPELAMLYDFTHKSHMIFPAIIYKPNDSWEFKLNAGFIDGEMGDGQGLEYFENKTFVGLKVKYKFN